MVLKKPCFHRTRFRSIAIKKKASNTTRYPSNIKRSNDQTIKHQTSSIKRSNMKKKYIRNHTSNMTWRITYPRHTPFHTSNNHTSDIKHQAIKHDVVHHLSSSHAFPHIKQSYIKHQTIKRSNMRWCITYPRRTPFQTAAPGTLPTWQTRSGRSMAGPSRRWKTPKRQQVRFETVFGRLLSE
jgi:hypothetical protein